MARSSYSGRGGGGGAPAAPPPRRVDPKLKFYNMIRWANYLLFPMVGMGFLVGGMIYGCFSGSGTGGNQEIARTLVIGGGILAYVSIFYNKR